VGILERVAGESSAAGETSELYQNATRLSSANANVCTPRLSANTALANRVLAGGEPPDMFCGLACDLWRVLPSHSSGRIAFDNTCPVSYNAACSQDRKTQCCTWIRPTANCFPPNRLGAAQSRLVQVRLLPGKPCLFRDSVQRIEPQACPAAFCLTTKDEGRTTSPTCICLWSFVEWEKV
jgi:hypothetical protein